MVWMIAAAGRSGKRALAALAVLLALAAPAAAQPARCVLRADLDGVVTSGTAEYLVGAAREAEARNCQALLVVVDTPGGFLEPTREIAQAFLDAPVPVVAYVAPSGARAGSAGVFLVLAAHVAAMAPGTNIGAAHPVNLGGGQGPDETMAEKIENDTAAFARALAERRGRNVAWAEAAVRESVSATANEALEQNVVDYVVPSVGALLDAIDGLEVPVGDRVVTLDTAEAEVRPLEQSLRQRVLHVLGDPNLAYVLLMLGLFALMIEFYHPGTLVFGAVGAFLLLLAGIGLRMLPVDAGAVILILVAIGLFVAEFFVTSFGLLALGGVVALALGSALLIDTADPRFFAEPEVDLSWGLVVPLAVVLGLGSLALGWWAARVRRRPAVTGAEALVGSVAHAASALGPGGGWVRVAGEEWRAVCPRELPEGAPVRVSAVRGLTLEVVPLEGPTAGLPPSPEVR